MVRALPCHGRGYGFEPRRSRQSSFAALAENEDCRAIAKRRRASCSIDQRCELLVAPKWNDGGRLGKPLWIFLASIFFKSS